MLIALHQQVIVCNFQSHIVFQWEDTNFWLYIQLLWKPSVCFREDKNFKDFVLFFFFTPTSPKNPGILNRDHGF